MSNHDCSCLECIEYAIEEGAHARRMGEPVLSNPYRNKERKDAWETGYMQEERFLRLGFVD